MARDGADVHLVARGAHLRALRERGLRWRTPEHDELLKLPASELSAVTPAEGDVVVLATKLQDAEQALELVHARFGPTVPVVTWTNGVHGQRWAVARFHTVVASVIYVPATYQAPGEACLWGQPYRGTMHLGQIRGANTAVRDALAAALQQADFEAPVHRDLAPVQNAKWVVNCGGAAQALVVADQWRQVADAAIAEARRIMGVAGLPVASDAELLPRPLSMGTIDGQQRGGGSTWQSLTSGRSLESRYLNGAIVELADEHGAKAPINEALVYAAARAEAEGWRAPSLRASEVLPGA